MMAEGMEKGAFHMYLIGVALLLLFVQMAA